MIDGAQSVPKFPVNGPRSVPISRINRSQAFTALDRDRDESGAAANSGRRWSLSRAAARHRQGHPGRRSPGLRVPARFEAGYLADRRGGRACRRDDWVQEVGIRAIEAHENQLTAYAPPLPCRGSRLTVSARRTRSSGRASSPSELGGSPPHMTSPEIPDRHGVAVRAGHHCAQILIKPPRRRCHDPRQLSPFYNTTGGNRHPGRSPHDARRIFGPERSALTGLPGGVKCGMSQRRITPSLVISVIALIVAPWSQLRGPQDSAKLGRRRSTEKEPVSASKLRKVGQLVEGQKTGRSGPGSGAGSDSRRHRRGSRDLDAA